MTEPLSMYYSTSKPLDSSYEDSTCFFSRERTEKGGTISRASKYDDGNSPSKVLKVLSGSSYDSSDSRIPYSTADVTKRINPAKPLKD
jgi:hypothetical protein